RFEPGRQTEMIDKITLEIVDGPEYSVEIDGDHALNHNAYKVRLRYQGRSMTVPWKQGLGITDDPDVERVMESLLSDAATVENARSVEDWGEELGYDTDSRKAEKIFRAVESQTNRLSNLLGDEYMARVFPEESATV